MTFAIHAWKDGQSVVTIRINPVAAVDKARLLERLGWQVHITDSAGHLFNSTDFAHAEGDGVIVVSVPRKEVLIGR